MNWCKCGGNCVPPSHPKSFMDVKCCHEIDNIKNKLYQAVGHINPTQEPLNCVTEHPTFKVLSQQIDVVEGFRHCSLQKGTLLEGTTMLAYATPVIACLPARHVVGWVFKCESLFLAAL